MLILIETIIDFISSFLGRELYLSKLFIYSSWIGNLFEFEIKKDSEELKPT